jgi:hypothetical protein
MPNLVHSSKPFLIFYIIPLIKISKNPLVLFSSRREESNNSITPEDGKKADGPERNTSIEFLKVDARKFVRVSHLVSRFQNLWSKVLCY